MRAAWVVTVSKCFYPNSYEGEETRWEVSEDTQAHQDWVSTDASRVELWTASRIGGWGGV